MAQGIQINCELTIPPEILRVLNSAPELALEAARVAAEHWHTVMLPRHFVPRANYRYRYFPRTARYLKQRRKAGKPDLVYSGKLQRELQRRTVSKDRDGAAVRMHAGVLSLIPDVKSESVPVRGKTYPNIRREIVATTPDEHRELSEVALAAIVAAMKKGGFVVK